jgi:hypothetical protein
MHSTGHLRAGKSNDVKERSGQENGALGEQAAQTRSTLSARPAFAMMG